MIFLQDNLNENRNNTRLSTKHQRYKNNENIKSKRHVFCGYIHKDPQK